MSDRDFEIIGKRCKLSKLDAIKQFHLLRRLTPILSDLVPVAIKLSQRKQINDDQFEALTPVLNGLSKLSDSDANHVLYGLLSTVEIQQSGGNWARVVIDGQLMFQDLELPILLQMAGRAFGYNLQGFLAVAPQVSQPRG